MGLRRQREGLWSQLSDGLSGSHTWQGSNFKGKLYETLASFLTV